MNFTQANISERRNLVSTASETCNNFVNFTRWIGLCISELFRKIDFGGSMSSKTHDFCQDSQHAVMSYKTNRTSSTWLLHVCHHTLMTFNQNVHQFDDVHTNTFLQIYKPLSGSRRISHTLLHERIRRRIRLCHFCTLINIMTETTSVSFLTLPVGFPLPTISKNSLYTLFCSLILDHGVLLKISNSVPKILISNFLLDASLHHGLQSVIIKS